MIDPDLAADPRIGIAFACCLFALLAACVQMAINTGKPPRPPDRGDRLPPGEYPIFPAF